MDAHPTTSYEALSALAQGPLPAWERVEARCQTLTLRRGAVLFEAGQDQPHVFVVRAGVVRMAYETAEGDVWIKGFAEAGTCFASLQALPPGGRTSFSAQAQTDALVDRIDYATLAELAQTHLAWSHALGNAFRLYGQRKEQREMALLTRTPAQRYLDLVHERPALVAVLRQRDIAAYLRITPVALSRIRARLLRMGAL